MSMYEQFETDPDLERQGIVLDYGDFRVTVARAGGANKRYAKVLEAESKPYRRAIDTETMDPDVALRIYQTTAARTLVVNWEVKRDGKWVKGIENKEDPTGKPLPVKEENIVKTFQNLPDLYRDIIKQSGKMSLYRKAILEADTKN